VVARGWHTAVRDLDGRRLSLRIGIHQDIVAVGLFGGKLRSDYTVLGRGVNIAARLEQRCRPGEIVLSDEVLRHIATDGLTVRDLGELELKGIPAPVRCHCIIPAEPLPRG
jgi:class 3 adenylate cyclase